MLSIQATLHQGNSKFLGAGKQCTANSLIAMAIAMEKSPKNWSTTDLDGILDEGDRLYSLIGSTKQLMICELPRTVMQFDVGIKQTYCGTVIREHTDIPFYNLNDSLKDMSQFCFLTIDCYTVAIIKADQWFYVFDSHSRNDCGMPSADGKAVVTGHSSLKNLITFLRHLSALLSNKGDQCFEVTHILLSPLNQSSQIKRECEYLSPSICSEFSGFSSISDGEYTCILQMIDENLQSCLLEIENCDEPVSVVGSSDVDIVSESDIDFGTDKENILHGELEDEVSEIKYDDVYAVSGVRLPDVNVSKDGEGKFEVDGTGRKRVNGSDDADVVQDSYLRFNSNDMTRDTEVGLGDEDEVRDRDARFGDVYAVKSEEGLVDSVVRLDTGNVELGMYTAVRLDDDYRESERRLGGESEMRLADVDVGRNGDVDEDNESEVKTGNVDVSRESDVRLADIDVCRESEVRVESEDTGVSRESIVRLNDADDCGENKVRFRDVDVGSDSVIRLEKCVDGEVRLNDCEQRKVGDNEEAAITINERESSLLDEAITDLDNSAVFLQSIDLNTFTDSDSDTIDYVVSENDVEDNMPLSFVAKKGKKYNKNRFQRHIKRQGQNNTDAENIPEVTDRLVDRNHVTRSRKRVRNESDWKRNIHKRLRNEGKKFLNKHEKLIPKRRLKPTCGVKCRYKCTHNFTDTERENILHSYWQLGCPTRRRQFLLKFSMKRVKARGRVQSSRQYSVKYFLPHLDSNKFDRVCKMFFLNTIDISHSVVDNAHKKTQLPGVSAKDGRGKSNGSRSNRTSEDKLDVIRNHIKSFAVVESHYCRKDSQKQYLDPSLSVEEMHRKYIKYCDSKGLEKVKLHTYRKLFNREFNFSFHKPLKDQCDLCISYTQASDEDKEKLNESYRSHTRNSQRARDSKDMDKAYAKQNLDVTVACFDLEEVLITPKGFASAFYYKRRLNTYNFTIYNLGNSEAHSFVWNETIASRGACEVASCVYHFIKQKNAKGCKRFVFYSDNCFAQNKNRFYVSMLWYCLQKFDIDSITHKYLEKGHTFNENDSVHAAIETALRHLTIYTSNQWAAVIHAARRTKPYVVMQMSLSDFFDFKVLSEYLKNFDLNEERQKVYISEVRILQVKSAEPNKYLYKYDYDDDEFSLVNLTTRVKRTSDTVPNPKKIHLKQLREELIPISLAKYNDLISLCLSDVIPSPNHAFFVLLPHQTE